MPLRAYALVHHICGIFRQLIILVIILIWCFCGLPLLLPLLLIFLLFSVIVYLSRAIFNRDTDHHKAIRLTPDERALLNKVGSSGTVQCLIFLNAPVVFNRLQDKLEGVVTGRPFGSMLDNLTRRLILDEQPLWREVDNFDISKHVREVKECFDSIEQVEGFVDQCSSEALNLANPLWEIKSCSFNQEGFLLLRFHPCVISGKRAMYLWCSSLADTSCEYSSPHRFPGNQTWKSALSYIVKFPFYLLKSWKYQTKTKQCRDAFFSKDRNFNNICKGRKRHAWSGKIHLPSLLHTAAVLRTTLSAVSLSALASSIRLLPNNFNDVDMFPVKLLYDFNNASTSSRGFPPSYREANITAPCNIEGAVPCLWTIRQTVTSLKGNIFPYLTSLTLRVFKVFSAHKLPFKFLSSLMMQRALCIFTSLSGSTATLYICGRRVQNVCMWYPVTSDVILSSSLMTYADECRICVELWEDCGIDPHELVKECQRQIEILMELMKNRQIPKRRRSVFYDDVDLDDLDLNCGDEVQDDTASVHVTKHMTKLFFERSKVDSMANGTGGDLNEATAASENEVECIDHYQLQDIPSVSKEAYLRDIDELPHRLSKDEQSTHPPTADFEVGIEISPPVERRNSAALL